jgi:hypothetical protein
VRRSRKLPFTQLGVDVSQKETTIMAADNKKTKCATTVSSNDGFRAFVLEGFPANMPEERMTLAAAHDMGRRNSSRMTGDAKPNGFMCPRITRKEV